MLQSSFFGHDQLVITTIASPCHLGATSLLNISFHTPYLPTLSSFSIIDRDTVHILSPHCHFLMFIAFFAMNSSNFANRVLVSWLAFLFVWIILTPRQIKWDQQYAEFEEHVKMPERNTTLDNWKNNQLSIGCDSLDAKIANEIEEKERGTIWSGLRRAKAQEKHLTK